MSIHCIDCPRYDKEHPEVCCSNSIRPKPHQAVKPMVQDNPDYKTRARAKVSGMAILLSKAEIEHIGC